MFANLPALLDGRRLALGVAHLDGPMAPPSEVLSPLAVGRVLAVLLHAAEWRVAEDADLRRFLAAPDASGVLTLQPRDDHGAPAAETLARSLVLALPEPDPEPVEYASALARTRAVAEARSRGWGSWSATAADEALSLLLRSQGDPVSTAGLLTAWRSTPALGPRASTLAARTLAEDHARTFIAHLPHGTYTRAEAWRQYLTAAFRSGVRKGARLSQGDFFRLLEEAARLSRRGAVGVVFTVPRPEPLTVEEAATRAADLSRIDALRRERAARPQPAEEPAP